MDRKARFRGLVTVFCSAVAGAVSPTSVAHLSAVTTTSRAELACLSVVCVHGPHHYLLLLHCACATLAIRSKYQRMERGMFSTRTRCLYVLRGNIHVVFISLIIKLFSQLYSTTIYVKLKLYKYFSLTITLSKYDERQKLPTRQRTCCQLWHPRKTDIRTFYSLCNEHK